MTATVIAAPIRRFRSLDHWRGVACLLVIVYHATLVHVSSAPEQSTGGVAQALLGITHTLNLGVALFFVISGYCITAAADNARRRQHSVRWYFMRRFRRIYPPFWIVVACSIAMFFLFDYGWRHPLLSRAPWAQLRPWWYSPSQWFGNLTLTETWRPYVFGIGRAHFPGQAWTLCYEEQFYLVTGLLLAFCARRFFAGAALVSAATIAVGIASRSAGVPVVGFFFDGSWLLFAAGVLVYYHINYATAMQARLAQAALLLAIPLGVWLSPIPGSIIGFAFAAALPMMHAVDDRLSTAVALKPLKYCGDMCYSLYLIHQIPVKAVSTALRDAGIVSPWATLLVTVPASLIVSLVLGWTFHVAVERRFLNSSASRADVSRVDSNPEPTIASLAGA